jgi:hypothetical protein
LATQEIVGGGGGDSPFGAVPSSFGGGGMMPAGYGGGSWMPGSYGGGGGGHGGGLIHSFAEWGLQALNQLTSRAIVQAMRPASAPSGFQPATGSGPGTTINFHGTNVIEPAGAQKIADAVQGPLMGAMAGQPSTATAPVGGAMGGSFAA